MECPHCGGDVPLDKGVEFRLYLSPRQQDLWDLLSEGRLVTDTQTAERAVDAAIHKVLRSRMYESIIERGGNLCIRYYPEPPGPAYMPFPAHRSKEEAASYK